jgi:hypothetical protein
VRGPLQQLIVIFKKNSNGGHRYSSRGNKLEHSTHKSLKQEASFLAGCTKYPICSTAMGFPAVI